MPLKWERWRAACTGNILSCVRTMSAAEKASLWRWENEADCGIVRMRSHAEREAEGEEVGERQTNEIPEAFQFLVLALWESQLYFPQLRHPVTFQ